MIVVIDYGVGNVKSVTNALQNIGCDAKVSCERDDLRGADGLILPGVGACGYAMEVLRKLDLVDEIVDIAKTGKPLLGICLGFQLLFDHSHEHGNHQCLGLIEGEVRKIPGGHDQAGNHLTIPHMGWNKVEIPAEMDLFKGLDTEEYFPFANSYYADITDKDAVAAYTNYGIDIAAAVQKGNVYGTQFHPEKSSSVGMNILKNFENICKKQS
jgi:glutamine amidotransferase